MGKKLLFAVFLFIQANAFANSESPFTGDRATSESAILFESSPGRLSLDPLSKESQTSMAEPTLSILLSSKFAQLSLAVGAVLVAIGLVFGLASIFKSRGILLSKRA